MSKLLNKKFILILTSTITLLIVLSIAIFFLTKENIKSFSKSGYIIASGKNEESIKYYFDEGTNYKTNIDDDLVFKDTSGDKVNAPNDNFLHYIDGDIKFLKNGVIMSLDSVNETIIPYYNITNKSILRYTKKSYYIEALDKTLAFNNIIGRISEDKYIVAGTSIKLNLSGNDKLIDGDYFEITFIKDGIVRIENQEVSYQTTAQGTYFLVNDNIKIDLGVKKIFYNDEEKMSITELTIDGNENIEIIPSEKDLNSDTPKDDEDKDNDQNKDNEQNNPNSPTTDNPTTDNPTTDNPTDGNGENNTGSGVTTTRNASIDILSAEVGVNNISAKFIINDPDKTIKGDLVVHITNTNTGKRVYSTIIDKTQNEFNIGISTLTPNSNYVLSINEENSGEYDNQYFQKLFKTNELGISLQKKYLTSDSIAYEVIFDEDTQVRSVTLSLLDENYQDIEKTLTITKDNSLAIFEELKNNTTYNISLDNVILNNAEYTGVYTLSKSVKTLKKTPYLNGLTSETDDNNNIFSIGIKNISDDDSSITSYHYYIYKADEITKENIDELTPVAEYIKTDASKVEVAIDGTKILPKTNYKFKVIAEYYDNEKYGEFETELSDNFILTGKPYISFALDTSNTTYKKISGIVTIKDENCTVPISGRECSSVVDYNNGFSIEYQVLNSSEKTVLDNIKFDPETLEYNLSVDSLLPNTEYIFNVYGDVDLLDGKGVRKGYHIGSFRANTNGIDILIMESWKQNTSSLDDLINVSAKIKSANNNDTLADSLNYLTFNLYAGDVKGDINAGKKHTPIATKTVSGNLKDEYYSTLFTINTLDTFEFKNTEIETEEGTTIITAIEQLKAKTDNKLQKYYTIEVTDAYDTGHENQILIENNLFVYTTPPSILLEQELTDPTITADAITNEMLKYESIEDKVYEKEYDDTLSDTTIVGYKLSLNANIEKISSYFQGSPVKEAVFYVCDANFNQNCTVDNAIEKVVLSLDETDNLETIMYLQNGTKYDVNDDKLTRGHDYIFKAKLNIDTDGDSEVDLVYPSQDVKTKSQSTPKQAPTYSIYIFKTTENTITYKYNFNDIDNALYDNKIYYTVDSDEKQEFEMDDTDFVIDNLHNDSVYSLSFKQALIKTKNNIQDINVGKYIFDGKYAYSSDTINFQNITYDNDNRLRVVILENEENQKLVNRVSAYEITLSAEGVTDYTKVYPTNKIENCTIDETDYKCIIIDYAKIKDFKKKDVTVKLTAYYDTGIINNDFTKISNSTKGYILQTNNNYNSNLDKGSYVYLNGSAVMISQIPYGIYEYNSNTASRIQIVNKIDTTNYIFKNQTPVSVFPTYANDAISIKDSSKSNISINNKLLDKVDLGTNNSTFKFNSYIPKINVTTKGLVNGSIITIKPVGIDNDILTNEFKNEDGKYYFYLKIYQDEEKTEVYKTAKVEIAPETTTLELTKYLPDTTYYFEVSAYMLKDNEYKETLLFDAKYNNDYVSSTYQFSTLPKEKIAWSDPEVSYTSSSNETNYLNRELTIKQKLNKNIGEYNIKLELYDKDENLVFTEIIDSISTTNSSYDLAKLVKDITNDDYVFGSNYYTLKTYSLTEVYDSTEQAELLIYSDKIALKTLKTPEISVTKNYGVNTLKFNINITDNDKVIKNGTYCVELLDSSAKEISGIDPICGLSALEINKEIVFDNLTSDTIYIFRTYADIYTNNINEENKERTIENRIVLSTSTDYGVALGSVAAYGNKKSVTLSFSSGVNVTNIKKINYSIMKGGGEEVKSETYIMGVDKNFTVEENVVRLIIDPEGLTLEPSSSYYIVMTFWVELDGELVKLNNKNYNYSVEF